MTPMTSPIVSSGRKLTPAKPPRQRSAPIATGRPVPYDGTWNATVICGQCGKTLDHVGKPGFPTRAMTRDGDLPTMRFQWQCRHCSSIQRMNHEQLRARWEQSRRSGFHFLFASQPNEKVAERFAAKAARFAAKRPRPKKQTD